MSGPRTLRRPRVSRSQLLLQERPAYVAALREEGARWAEALGARLGTSLVLEGAALLPEDAPPGTPPSGGCAFAVLDLSAAGGHALLEMELGLVEAVLSSLSGAGPGLEGATCLTRAEEAGFGFFCLLALDACRRRPEVERRWAPRLAALGSDLDRLAARLARGVPHVTLALSLAVGGRRGALRLRLPSPLVERVLLDVPETRSHRGLPAEISQATVAFRTTAGRTTLDERQMGSLRVGDVVLCGGLRILEGGLRGELRLFAKGLSCRALATDRGLQIEQLMPLAQPSDMTVLHTPDPTAEVSVDVEVELASVRLTLEALTRMRPGELLPLRVGISEPVLLKMGDQVLAHAELVELDGEVGARILSLGR